MDPDSSRDHYTMAEIDAACAAERAALARGRTLTEAWAEASAVLDKLLAERLGPDRRYRFEVKLPQ